MVRCGLIGLAIIVAVLAHGRVYARAGSSPERIGPSFDCGAVQTPGAQLICSDADLSRTDLIFVQAYYALRHQVGPAGWQALKVEAVDFEDRTLQRCGVPITGSLPRQPGPSIACVSAEYKREQAVWLSRLSGPAAEEARRPIEQHIELQRGLQALGFLPPTEKIDGVYGAATRAGVLAWQQSQGIPLTGFLGDADSVRLSQQVALAQSLPTPRASIPSGMSTSPSAVSATKERVPFGNHAGETAYVIKSEGVGTANASLQILMDWDREVRACSDEYLTYIPGEKDENGYRRCISYAQEHFSGPEVRTARANCQTGEMWSFRATAPRFYAGQIKQTFEANAYSKGGIYYSHVFQYEGFRMPDIGATNVAVDGEVFRRLCPMSFTEPPKTDPPELYLSSDCQGMLADAERTATEAGVGHVLNIRIIDAWDVKREASSEYESKCSAKILLNTGEKGLLEYKEIPLHGKYFIQTNILP